MPKQPKVPVYTNGSSASYPGGPIDPATTPASPANPATPAAPAPPVISASEDPTLQAIDEKYAKYGNDLENNTGRVLDQATSATRDAFAGLRQQTGEDYKLRGVGGGEALRDIDNETGRAIAGQHAQIARNREEQMLGALNARNQARQGAIGAMQGEKRIGLEGYGMHNQAMQSFNAQNAQNAATQFDQLLAMMQAQRSSPSNGQGGSAGYGGPGSPSGGVGPPLYAGGGGAGSGGSLTGRPGGGTLMRPYGRTYL